MTAPRAALSALLGLLLLATGCGGSAGPDDAGVSAEGGVATGADATVDATTDASAYATPRPTDATGDASADAASPPIDASQEVTPCGPDRCLGCCAQNRCFVGNDPMACGRGGAPCADCTSVGGACVASDAGLSGGACKTTATCGPTLCPAGCCDANGACQAGTSAAACGAHGAACQTCPADMACGVGAAGRQCNPLPCNPQTCADGCCSPLGICNAGQRDTACGAGGASCQDCASMGVRCAPNQQCASDDGGTCTCPLGCCDAMNRCHPGASNKQCGTGGAACSDCTTSGSQCAQQQCADATDAGVCNQETCPSGCCDALDVCQQGIANTICGGFGTTCLDCLANGDVCSRQQCAAPDGGSACGAFNCSDGCCDSFGNCQRAVSSDTSCGRGGALCVDCTRLGARCQGGSKCIAPDGGTPCSQSCTGCCDADGGCRAGFADTQCGGSGSACQDCTALAPPSTCNVDVSPSVCTTPQNACPAVYSGCPAALQEQAPTRQLVCPPADIQNAAAACAGGAHTFACASFQELEFDLDTPCYHCLQGFAFDFDEQAGIRACVAPYVDAVCNRNSACLVDCLTDSCYDCGGWPSTERCDVQTQSGTCSVYAQADACVTQALGGPAAVCNPDTYQRSFGAWLAAVGAKYCGR